VVKEATRDAVNAAEKHLSNTRDLLVKFRKASDDARDNLDAATKRVAELKGQVQGLREQLAQKDEETNPHRMTLRDLRKKQKSLAADIEDCAKEKQSVELRQQRAKFWTKGFKDIRLFVLEEIIEELELNTNAMLDEAGLVGWNVRYELERETARGTVQRGLQILVSSPDSEGMVKWESWSGGEAQRLRIVGALALSETLLNHAGIEISMEVLDEPTQHLSPEGVADLCEYLSDRARRLHRQVFYIDHASIESTAFASVTTIRRDAGGSNIDG
jgi:DNA repair exonuclease SbcCD ATPase subunit